MASDRDPDDDRNRRGLRPLRRSASATGAAGPGLPIVSTLGGVAAAAAVPAGIGGGAISVGSAADSSWRCPAARSAAANSSAVWKRSSGRLASALRTTASIAPGTCTLKRDGGSGSSASTLCMVAVDDPVNGRSPVRNW